MFYYQGEWGKHQCEKLRRKGTEGREAEHKAAYANAFKSANLKGGDRLILVSNGGRGPSFGRLGESTDGALRENKGQI